jgi:hypothetical protein
MDGLLYDELSAISYQLLAFIFLINNVLKMRRRGQVSILAVIRLCAAKSAKYANFAKSGGVGWFGRVTGASPHS